MSAPIVSAPSEEVAALHAQVRHYESELTERDTVIAEHQAVIAQRDAMIEHLQEQVRLLVARRFAPSSEKITDGQLGLFNEAEATAAEEPESAPGTEIAAHRRGTPPPWRQTPSKSPSSPHVNSPVSGALTNRPRPISLPARARRRRSSRREEDGFQ